MRKILLISMMLCCLVLSLGTSIKLLWAEAILYEEISMSGTQTVYTGTSTIYTEIRPVKADIFFGAPSGTVLRIRYDGNDPTDSSPKLYDSGYLTLDNLTDIKRLKLRLSAGSVGTATIIYSAGK